MKKENMIEMKNVSLYRDHKSLLCDIDWTVKPGEHWAILGLNGAGKTSLLRMICGDVLPSRGSVQVLGQAFGRCDLRELRRQLGWVSSAILERLYGHHTVQDVVLSGMFASIGLYEKIEGAHLKRAQQAMSRLDVDLLSYRRLDSLSEGEKKRVLIARALMAKPQILILDEPCAGLDLFNREAFLQTIENLAQQDGKMSILYVTHHTDEVLPIFTRTMLLRRGSIHSSGETTSLMSPENLEDFFERPVGLECVKERTYVFAR